MRAAFPLVAARPGAADEHAAPGVDAPLSARGCGRARPRCRPACAPSPTRRGRACGPPLRGGAVYTDDRAPVEWLIDASIVKVAANGER